MGACCTTLHTVKEKDYKVAEQEQQEWEARQEQEREQEREKAREQEQKHFEEIVDGKHLKYMEHHENKTGEYWGIGIENESYLQWSVRRTADDFCHLKRKRERYSLDYYKNFVSEPMEKAIAALSSYSTLTYPIFVNSHTFQKMDAHLQHRTFYDLEGTLNPSFTESIHDRLLRESSVHREMYDVSVVFDGDTIEFITQDYYCATVEKAVNELIATKERWISDVGPRLSRIALENGWPLPLGAFEFPQRNEGLVTFLSTDQKSLGICNTQTLHLNLTLPTPIRDGVMEDKHRFVQDHLAFISMIQVVEPLIVAAYGSPDPFALVDGEYSIGSQRVTRSRYISLQTFDVDAPVNGKLLLRPCPEDSAHWYNRLVQSPYQLHTEIGYDINFNKFKGHGVEIRFLDWFPEKYIKGLMDFFVLLGAHALAVGRSSYQKDNYHDIILTCIRRGFTGRLRKEEVIRILEDMGLPEARNEDRKGEEVAPYSLLCSISAALYQRYCDSETVRKMSPNMQYPPFLVNYNEIAFREIYRGIHGKQPLVIRAERSPFEERAPLTPQDVYLLLDEYRVYVESSSTRCFSDEDYRNVGANIIPRGTWMTYPRALVVGLKEIRKGELPHPTQTLFHFAHCFKQQEGWREALEPLRKAAQFIDYEFMLDDEGKRTLSFCKQAGHVGGYLTLLSYYGWCSPLRFSEDHMDSFLKKRTRCRVPPRILVVGCGTVGKACMAVFDTFGLSYTVKRSTDQILPEEILSYDIYVHAIRLMPERVVTPFLTESDLDRMGRRLTLITDLSCDLGHHANPLPIYHQYGTRERPVQRLREGAFFTPPDGPITFSPPLDLLAVPYLPSFDPIRSSNEFSNDCAAYLIEWPWMNIYPEKSIVTRAMTRSLETFRRIVAEVETQEKDLKSL
jgi:hypothetical protein